MHESIFTWNQTKNLKFNEKRTTGDKNEYLRLRRFFDDIFLNGILNLGNSTFYARCEQMKLRTSSKAYVCGCVCVCLMYQA